MVPKNVYRLNEYRISEFADGRLWWDTHSGFGTQIGGPCFVYGSILVIGTRSNEENGFLKLEFFGLDNIRLPLRPTALFLGRAVTERTKLLAVLH